MNIQINHKPTETQATQLEELVAELALPNRGVAIAIANKMVPRTEWANTQLKENDEITIIKAAFGG